jgi:putative sterol carrier protein
MIMISHRTNFDSIDSYISHLGTKFKFEKPPIQTGTVQFFFSGTPSGKCYFTIKTENITVKEGTAETPQVTVRMSFDQWMDALSDKIDIMDIFYENKMKVQGDIGLLLVLIQQIK